MMGSEVRIFLSAPNYIYGPLYKGLFSFLPAQQRLPRFSERPCFVGAALAANSYVFSQTTITLTQTRVVSSVHETRRKYVPVGLRPASLRATVSCTELTTHVLSTARIFSGRCMVAATSESKGGGTRGFQPRLQSVRENSRLKPLPRNRVSSTNRAAPTKQGLFYKQGPSHETGYFLQTGPLPQTTVVTLSCC